MSKPEWAMMMDEATRMERKADRLRQEAQVRRCPMEESGGVQCSADGGGPHFHRWHQEDLPTGVER